MFIEYCYLLIASFVEVFYYALDCIPYWYMLLYVFYEHYSASGSWTVLCLCVASIRLSLSRFLD